MTSTLEPVIKFETLTCPECLEVNLRFEADDKILVIGDCGRHDTGNLNFGERAEKIV